MNESNKRLQEVVAELYHLAISDKIKFLEELLFHFTLTGRGIWSDDKPSDPEKIEAFRWLNELSHRIWNIRSELQQNEDTDSVTRFYENMKFYGEKSDLLRMHLVPATLNAFEKFRMRQ